MLLENELGRYQSQIQILHTGEKFQLENWLDRDVGHRQAQCNGRLTICNQEWNRLKAIKNGIDQKIFLISIHSVAAAAGVADQNGFNGRLLAPASFNAMNVVMTQAWQKAKCKFAKIYFSLLHLLEA